MSIVSVADCEWVRSRWSAPEHARPVARALQGAHDLWLAWPSLVGCGRPSLSRPRQSELVQHQAPLLTTALLVLRVNGAIAM